MAEAMARVLDVLLVEDNDDDVEAVRRVFARMGLEARLRVARDGQEGLDLLFGDDRARLGVDSTSRLPVVLLDLSLPRIGGLDLLRCMKADPGLRAVPTVVLSGSAEPERMWECLHTGCNLYVLKPMNIADVANIVSGAQRYWLGDEQLRRAA